VDTIGVGVIGTGWCGRIRAATAAASPLIGNVHVAEIRFNAKQALAYQKLRDGSLGEPVTALVSRHITRRLGDKISGRIKLSPAAMEATHDIDFLLWCLSPARPVLVYAQAADGIMRTKYEGRTPCGSS
jgi:predicted dehydrogenase